MAITIVRFLVLVLLLNVLRYVVAGPIEAATFLPRLFAEMERHRGLFNTDFTTADWVTSYLYNFVVWLSAAWLFHLARPALARSDFVASLEVFGVCWLFFAAVSGVYMNHYASGRAFYGWNVLDSAIVFVVVAAANGVLYRPVMGPSARRRPASRPPFRLA